MNNMNKKVTLYLVSFFLIIVVAIISFFFYKFSTNEIKNGVDDKLYNPEFNDFFNETDKKPSEDKEYVSYEEKSCFIDDKEFKHGEALKFYSRAAVGVYEICDDFSIKKRCIEGVWLGEYRYEFNSCIRTIDCKLDDRTTIKNGESIKLYDRKVVEYGDNCERYLKERTCKETILTGNNNFKYEKCNISNVGTCKIDDDGTEEILANNSSHRFYVEDKVAYTESCDSSKYFQNRMCIRGNLSGDATFSRWSCNKEIPKDCIVGNLVIPHSDGTLNEDGTQKGTVTLYSKSRVAKRPGCRFYSQKRECVNGELSGQEEYTKEVCREV